VLPQLTGTPDFAILNSRANGGEGRFPHEIQLIEEE
jgi:hypothetical protein